MHLIKNLPYLFPSLKEHCLTFTFSLQAHHMDSTLKRRGNGCFHVVSMWNPRGMFVGYHLLEND